jgi:hypothetical protein
MASFDTYGYYLHAMTDLDSDGLCELLFSMDGSIVAIENGTGEILLTRDLFRVKVPSEMAGNWLASDGNFTDKGTDHYTEYHQGFIFLPREEFVSLEADKVELMDNEEVKMCLNTSWIGKPIPDKDIVIDPGFHGRIVRGLMKIDNYHWTFTFKPGSGYDGPCSVTVKVNVTSEVAITRAVSLSVERNTTAIDMNGFGLEHWFEPVTLRPGAQSVLKVRLKVEDPVGFWVQTFSEDPSDLAISSIGKEDMTWSFCFKVPFNTTQIMFRLDIGKNGMIWSSERFVANVTYEKKVSLPVGSITLDAPDLDRYAEVGSPLLVMIRYSGDPLVGGVRFRYDDGPTYGNITYIHKNGKDIWCFYYIVPDRGSVCLKVFLMVGNYTVASSHLDLLTVGDGEEIVPDENVSEDNATPEQVSDNTPIPTPIEPIVRRTDQDTANVLTDQERTMIYLIITVESIVAVLFISYAIFLWNNRSRIRSKCESGGHD